MGGQRTQENYAEKIKADIGDLSSRVWITEFGSDLRITNRDGSLRDYSCPDASNDDGNVNMLRGLRDALQAFKVAGRPVKGAFHWHGWPNGDNYDFWYDGNKNGASAVCKILGLS